MSHQGATDLQCDCVGKLGIIVFCYSITYSEANSYFFIVIYIAITYHNGEWQMFNCFFNIVTNSEW